MTLVERMDIFRPLYVERLNPPALNRAPSSITRELEKGMDNGMYNPYPLKPDTLRNGGTGAPALK
jgi:hypothetical protein